LNQILMGTVSSSSEGETMDTLINDVLPKLGSIVHYFAVLCIFAAVLWAAVAAIGMAPGIKKKRLKWVLGCLGGGLMFAMGWLPTPAGHVPWPEMQEWAGLGFSILSGWMTAVGVGKIHDFIKHSKGMRP
jgi:drug/metabolite transporter (DMT)-like permease